MLTVVILSQILILFLINTDDLNSAHNQTYMNVHLQWRIMKLHRQYMNYLHLVVTSQVSNLVSCDEHCTLAKVWSLVWHWSQCLVWWAYHEQCVITSKVCPVGPIDCDATSWSYSKNLWKVWNNLTLYLFLCPTLWLCEPVLKILWALTFSWNKLNGIVTFFMHPLPKILMICDLFEYPT